MTISVTNLGAANENSGATLSLTTSITVPSGSLIVIAVDDGSITSGPTMGTLSDGTNTYTNIVKQQTGGNNTWTGIWYCENCGLASGSTITYTAVGSGGVKEMIVLFATGIATSGALDTAVTNTSTTTGTTSPVSGTPTGSGELFIGISCSNAGTSLSYTQSSGWTNTSEPTESGHQLMFGGYQINAGSSALTYNPTCNTSGQISNFIVAFIPGATSLALEALFEGGALLGGVEGSLVELALSNYSGMGLVSGFSVAFAGAEGPLAGEGSFVAYSGQFEALNTDLAGSGSFVFASILLMTSVSTLAGSSNIDASALLAEVGDLPLFSSNGAFSSQVTGLDAVSGSFAGIGNLDALLQISIPATAVSFLIGSGSFAQAGNLSGVLTGSFEGAGSLSGYFNSLLISDSLLLGVGNLEPLMSSLLPAVTAFTGFGNALAVSALLECVNVDLAGSSNLESEIGSLLPDLVSFQGTGSWVSTSYLAYGAFSSFFGIGQLGSLTAPLLESLELETFSGAGSISNLSGNLSEVLNISFEGQGNFAGEALLFGNIKTPLEGVGSFLSLASQIEIAASSFAGTGNLDAFLQLNIPSSAVCFLAGSGSFTLNVNLSGVLNGSFGGTGITSGYLSFNLISSSLLSGTGNFESIPTLLLPVEVAFTGLGDLFATSSSLEGLNITFGGSDSFQALMASLLPAMTLLESQGVLAGGLHLLEIGLAPFIGTGSFFNIANQVEVAQAALVGAGNLDAFLQMNIPASAVSFLAGSGSLEVLGNLEEFLDGSFVGMGSFEVTPGMLLIDNALFTGQGDFATTANLLEKVGSVLVGSSLLSVPAGLGYPTQAVYDGDGSATFFVVNLLPAISSFAGSSLLLALAQTSLVIVPVKWATAQQRSLWAITAHREVWATAQQRSLWAITAHREINSQTED